MELSGEEKKLQALFSELKAAEEQAPPRFATVWNRAAIKPRRARAFAPALVAVMGLLVCAVLGFAVWSRYREPARTPAVAHVETPATTSPEVIPTVPSNPGPTSVSSDEIKVPRRHKPVVKRNSAQLAANRKLTQEAKAISEWESPTSALLSSPSDSLFSSLPQLNENANGLQTYLPNRPK